MFFFSSRYVLIFIDEFISRGQDKLFANGDILLQWFNSHWSLLTLWTWSNSNRIRYIMSNKIPTKSPLGATGWRDVQATECFPGLDDLEMHRQALVLDPKLVMMVLLVTEKFIQASPRKGILWGLGGLWRNRGNRWALWILLLERHGNFSLSLIKVGLENFGLCTYPGSSHLRVLRCCISLDPFRKVWAELAMVFH